MSSSIEVTRADVDRLYGLAFSRQMEKSAQWRELGAGALGGAGLGALLGFLTPRDKDEDKVGRYLRYILGGAALGGITGFGYGSSKHLFGDDSGGSGGNGGNGGSSGNGGAGEDGRFTRWFRGRPSNIAANTGIGAAGGWLAPKLLHLTGQVGHFFTPGPGTAGAAKNFAKQTFSKRTFQGKNPVRWISNIGAAFRENLGYASKIVKDRVRVAMNRGFISKSDYSLFTRGIKPSANPAQRAEALKIMRSALNATKPSGNWLMRAFRPAVSDKKLSQMGAIEREIYANRYAIRPGEIGSSAGGRKLFRVGGPLIGAVLGALESPENQGGEGR